MWGDDLILESLVLPKTTLLILQSEVSSFHLRATSFLFPETEVFLDEFFETNKTIFHIIFHIHYLTWWKKFLVNDYLTVKECGKHHFVF
jgi:hypothetical protein